MKTLAALALTVLASMAIAAAFHENSPKGHEFETIESVRNYDNCTPCRANALTARQKKALAKLREQNNAG